MKLRRSASAALVLALVVLPLIGECVIQAQRDFLVDFSAFYCAGRAVAARESPYTLEPLRQCEQATAPGLRSGKNPTVVLPAPLPGYAVAAFVPLALLPFSLAAAFWIGVLLAAYAVCVVAAARVARVPWQVGAAALSLSLAAFSIPFGQIVPLVLAAIGLSALFALQQRWRAAALAALVSMVEPHLGVAVCGAIALAARPARLTLAIGLGALALLSLLVLGPAENVRYLTQVLPAHALSEASFGEQYSATAVLTALGVADTVAVRVGSIWYFAMVLTGITVAVVVARSRANAAFLALAPAAFAVFGGVYVHLTQIAVAVAPALLALRYEVAARRVAAVVALLLLAFPWRMAPSPVGWLGPIFPIGYLAWFYSNKNLRIAIVAGALAALAIVAIDHTIIAHAGAVHRPYVGTAIDPRLPEAPWSEYLRANRTPTAASWLMRLPTWTGLAMLLGLLVSTEREAPALRR